jgi:acyl-coenzyme A synthetase/AMP-(fatty) acid ligase
MPNSIAFLGLNKLPAGTPVLSDDQTHKWINIEELIDISNLWETKLNTDRSLLFIYIRNCVNDIAKLLAALKSNHVVALLDPELPRKTKDELEKIYKPRFVFEDENLKVLSKKAEYDLHPDLFILLSTSGSTGSPKFVKLTKKNIESNASAICNVLDIGTSDVACGHLPLHYSYGLSVLTSHLYAGASTHLTTKGFLDDSFWSQMRAWRISHLPGVPFHYITLMRYGFSKLDLPDLRVLTQAGGALDSKISKVAHEFMDNINGRFHIMYGQTEAAPRLTTLSHEDFRENPLSVGKALPGGRIEIHNNGIEVENGIEGDVIYHGENVMMGYAECSKDLSKGDVQKNTLITGDVGILDSHKRLTITGRSNRMGKIAGLRVNLDEIEKCLLQIKSEFAVIQKLDNLIIFFVPNNLYPNIKDDALNILIETFTLPKVAYKFKEISSIPRTSRKKIDYQILAKT